MKNILKIVFICGLLSLVGCSEQAHLHRLQRSAERELQDISQAINQNDMTALWETSQRSPEIQYFVKLRSDIIFWSDNVLTAEALNVDLYDEWHTIEMANATCSCLWKRVGIYDVLVAIPIQWTLNAKDEIAQSYSYRPLLNQPQALRLHGLKVRTRAQLLHVVTIGLFVLIVFLGLFSIIRHNGSNNLPLRLKIFYAIMAIQLIAFASLFFLADRYIYEQSVLRQENMLRQKCYYVRYMLEEKLHFVYNLEVVSSDGLFYDLNSMARIYDSDIHVYDLGGRLKSSSTPQLFEHNVLPRYLAPKILFSDSREQVCVNSLGQLQYMCAYSVLENDYNVPIGYIAMPSFISEEMIVAEIERYTARFLPIYLLALLIAIGLSSLLSRAISSPIRLLSEEMIHASLDKTYTPIVYQDQDEIGELVERYNTLMKQLQQSAQRIAQTEREGAWRTMARQVAHEINNPLTPMKLSIQQLQRTKGTERFDELFDRTAAMLMEEIDNLNRIVTSFSTFAQMPQVEVTEVDVARKLSDIITLMENNAPQIDIRYIGASEGVEVQADRNQIGQVFTNILTNAIQALQHIKDGNIIVVLKQLEQEVEISISDNGSGIPKEIQDKIFNPYFTTKTTGTGLGLAISKNIIEAMGGRIAFQTSQSGTTFYVYLKKQTK